MYWQDKWVFKDTIEYEIKYAGNYGLKGEKRGKKTKPTPEQIKRQNQLNKEKKMRRLLKANFEQGDLWLTLKYKKGAKPCVSSVEKELKRFISLMRRRYKSHNAEFKFVYRIEIGSQGGVHIHMVVPRIRGADTEILIQEAWKVGRVNYQTLDNGDYKELASYITKPLNEETYKQLSFLPSEEVKKFVKYSSSRNLTRPKPIRKEYSRRTVHKMLLYGPEPSKGYFIVKESVFHGYNSFTGMSYLHYTERKLDDG